VKHAASWPSSPVAARADVLAGPRDGKTTLARGLAQVAAALAATAHDLVEINPHGLPSDMLGRGAAQHHCGASGNDPRDRPRLSLLCGRRGRKLAVRRSTASVEPTGRRAPRDDAVMLGIDEVAQSASVFSTTTNFIEAIDEGSCHRRL